MLYVLLQEITRVCNIRKNIGLIYKTCVVCCERIKQKSKQCSHCSFATYKPLKLNLHIKTIHNKIKAVECNFLGMHLDTNTFRTNISKSFITRLKILNVIYLW